MCCTCVVLYFSVYNAPCWYVSFHIQCVFKGTPNDGDRHDSIMTDPVDMCVLFVCCIFYVCCVFFQGTPNEGDRRESIVTDPVFQDDELTAQQIVGECHNIRLRHHVTSRGIHVTPTSSHDFTWCTCHAYVIHDVTWCTRQAYVITWRHVVNTSRLRHHVTSRGVHVTTTSSRDVTWCTRQAYIITWYHVVYTSRQRHHVTSRGVHVTPT